jgi:hypothetical protein
MMVTGFVLKYPSWIRPPFPPTPPIPNPTPAPAPPPRPIAPGDEAKKTGIDVSVSLQAGGMAQFGYRQPNVGSVYFQATGNVLVCKNILYNTDLLLNLGTQHLFTVSERFPVGRPGSRGGTDLQLFVGTTVTRKDLFSVPGLSLGFVAQAQAQNLLPFLNDSSGFKPVAAFGLGAQLGYKLPFRIPGVSELSLGIGGMGLLYYSFWENHLRSRVSTGSQWTGFVNIDLGRADDNKER